MDKFNLSDKKYYLFIAFIVMVFVLVIWQAFSYLPPEKTGVEAMQNYIPESSVPSETDNNYQVKTTSDNSDNGTDNVKSDTSTEKLDNPPVPTETISEIPEDSPSAAKVDNKTRAEGYKKDGNYIMAAEVYVNMAESASSADEKADLYESASTSYGMAKRYGTALAYAQKAYNMSPSTNREVLLARLYYKTGDYSKANDRMNNVMRRDFIADR